MSVAISMGFERTFIPFSSDSPWIDLGMLLVGFPIDFGKDLGWIPNCYCKVRFPNDFEMFLIGFSIVSELVPDGFPIVFVRFLIISPIDFERVGVGFPVGSARQIT